MSERPVPWVIPDTRCKHLRNKQYYMDLPYHSSGFDNGDHVACWCTKTLQVFGPDGEIATNHDCTEERTCFEKDDF